MRRLVAGLVGALLLGAMTPVVAGATDVDRLEGRNRYDTSVSVSKSAWNEGNTDVIYLARGDVLADALSAGVLRGGPILLTQSGSYLLLLMPRSPG